MRDLALDHAAGRLEDAVYLERLRALREMKESLERTTNTGITAERAVEWLRTLSESWTRADVPEAKADLFHAIYEEIVVTGRKIMSNRLTPSAYAHGLVGFANVQVHCSTRIVVHAHRGSRHSPIGTGRGEM